MNLDTPAVNLVNVGLLFPLPGIALVKGPWLPAMDIRPLIRKIPDYPAPATPATVSPRPSRARSGLARGDRYARGALCRARPRARLGAGGDGQRMSRLLDHLKNAERKRRNCRRGVPPKWSRPKALRKPPRRTARRWLYISRPAIGSLFSTIRNFMITPTVLNNQCKMVFD